MKRKELRKEFRNHRRSVSQLMEEMDRISETSSGIVNHGMSSGSIGNLDVPDDLGSGSFQHHDPLSPDSEYDETLEIPDDSCLTLVTSMGNHNNPVLVKKQGVDGDSSGSDTDEDDNKTIIRTYNEVPYESIYSSPVKFHSYDRQIFIPGTQIHVQITNYEKSMTAHLFNPILYTIQLTHGSFVWTVKKRYKDFSNLHNQLRIFRTSLNFPLPSRTHREIRSSFRNNNKISISTISTSNMNVSSDESNKRKRKTKKKKGSLPRFPKRPDTLISTDQIPARIKQLEKYLYNLLNISLYRNHYDTVNFLEVSTFSFVNALGEKGRETIIKKRTGSTNAGQKKCNFLNCLALGCCIRCNYLCSDLICGQWQQRWLIVKETFLALQNPKNGLVRSVILFDNGFDISMGLYSTGLNSGLQIVTNSKYIVLKFSSKKQAKEWASHLKMVANTSARDFTSPNPFNSFAPTRPSTLSGWFVDGSSYMSAVADALEGAVEDIFIADWWLSPEIYMKRPTLDGEYWRLDKILLRKARQGVRIFILLYKEVEMALGINSFYSKQKLAQLHENIKLLRHPDHVRVGVFFWAHHEKLVVIDQTYAFVGGIDLCYGRWDTSEHRLTDLGSISISNKSPSVRSFTIVENPIKSLIMSSKGILQATAAPALEIQTISMMTTTNLTAIDEANETEQIDEHTKQDTPEMKRKGLTEKIKDNMKSTTRELMNRLTLHGDENGVEPPVTVKIETPLEVEPPTHFELDGQAKFWIGKDYTNFILKDFTELNQPFADLIDRTKTPRMPWHDIASVIVGQASRDVARHFIERWNSCKFEKARDNVSYPYLMPKSYNDIRIDQNFFNKTKVHLDRVTCQVLRSAADWSTGFIEGDTYEQSIHEAYVETITKSQHYIYIENQFFISLGFPDSIVKNQIAESLYKRIIRAHKEKKVFRVFVVLPLLPGFEGEVAGPSGNALRLITHWNYASICRADNSIIRRLLKFGVKNPMDYISFHSLRNHSVLDSNPITELIYVHSKLLIVDDKTVIIGSANINDRSMLGKRDSEVAVVITDEAFEDGKMNGESFPCGVYAGHLRKHLFQEHLGLLATDRNVDITDPIADSFFKDVWQKTSKANTKIFDDIFKCIPNDNVRNFVALKKYNDVPALCKTSPEEAETKLKDINGFLVDLPLNFLCEEILTPSNLSREGIVGMNLWT